MVVREQALRLFHSTSLFCYTDIDRKQAYASLISEGLVLFLPENFSAAKHIAKRESLLCTDRVIWQAFDCVTDMAISRAEDIITQMVQDMHPRILERLHQNGADVAVIGRGQVHYSARCTWYYTKVLQCVFWGVFSSNCDHLKGLMIRADDKGWKCSKLAHQALEYIVPRA